jgi:dihydroorotate dehydrogenase
MGRTMIYEQILRPLLFCLPPETAHELGQAALAREWPWRLIASRESGARLRTRVGGLDLSSPIGLGAGLDKNGDSVPGLQYLGFGYLAVGSIRLEPSGGNPRPRLIRYPETESLGNCYGLPSAGLDACVAKFRALAARKLRTKLVANINAETVEEYVRCVGALAPYADAVELALRCPNRSDHLSIYPPDDLAQLLGEIRRRWPGTAAFVKLPPYFDDAERDNRMELVELSIGLGLTGVVIPGNWSIPEPRLSRGQASLSGRATFERNLKIVREVAAVARGRIAVKASGGVSTGAEALQILAAGASLIDILTAFVYRGWSAAADINRELIGLMEQQRIDDVRALQPMWA